MKAGTWMMNAMNALMEWQLENTEAEKEAATEWVKANSDHLLRDNST